jgi:ABC-type cobalamin/Fe3+-siderophores transport system ATPase subunit
MANALKVVVLAGPNGAGKSTSASRLLRSASDIRQPLVWEAYLLKVRQQ